MTHAAYPEELRHLHDANALGFGASVEDGPRKKLVSPVSSMDSVEFAGFGDHSIGPQPLIHRLFSTLTVDFRSVPALSAVYGGEALDRDAQGGLQTVVDSFLSSGALSPPEPMEDPLSGMREQLLSFLQQSGTPKLPTNSNGPAVPPTETNRVELIDHLITLHHVIHPKSTESPKCTWMIHLLTTLLASLLQPLPSLPPNTLDIPRRAKIISVLVKNVLCPAVKEAVRDDIYFLSVSNLGVLLPTEMRVPRETLDKVIRPVLKPVCSVTAAESLESCPSLMGFLGLCHTVDLIPQLFNRMFAAKVLQIVGQCMTKSSVLFKHPDRHQILPLLIRLFSSMARCVDCSKDVAPLCGMIGDYLASSASDLPSPQRETVQGNITITLFHFLCCYPETAADALLQPSNRNLLDTLTKLPVFAGSPISSEVRSRYMAAGPAALASRFPAKEFLFNRELSDVSLLIGPSKKEIPAHKIVLMRSAYFGPLFCNGMLESSESTIHIDEDEEVFPYVLHHIYESPLALPSDCNFLLAIHRAATYFCLPALQTECEGALVPLISASNSLDVAQAVAVVQGSEEWSVIDQKCRDALFSEPCRLADLDMHDPVVRRLICKPLVNSM